MKNMFIILFFLSVSSSVFADAKWIKAGQTCWGGGLSYGPTRCSQFLRNLQLHSNENIIFRGECVNLPFDPNAPMGPCNSGTNTDVLTIEFLVVPPKN